MRDLSEPRGSLQETNRWVTKLKTIMYAKCTRVFFMLYLSESVWKFWLMHFVFYFVNFCLLMNQYFLLQKRHRGESLMDMHSKKLEKEKVKNWFTSFYLMEPRGIEKFRWSLSSSIGLYKSLFACTPGPGLSKDGKLNLGFTKILNKVFLSKNMSLELTKYCWVFTSIFNDDNTECYSTQCI